MGRGRGQRGGSRGRGSRGGRGRSRGGGGQFNVSRKSASHMQQFGEQHPSEDIQNFSAVSSKRGKFDWKTSRGRGRGGNNSKYNGRDISSDEDSSESGEESTPYEQLLAVYSGDKNNRKAIQVVSESESESDDMSESKSDGIPADGSDGDRSDISESVDEHQEIPLDNDSDSGSDGESDSLIEESSGNTLADTMSSIGNSEENENVPDEDMTDKDYLNEDETVIEDAEIDPELNEENLRGDGDAVDPFIKHFERQMNENMQQDLKTEKHYKTHLVLEWPSLEQFHFNGLSLNTKLTKSTENFVKDKFNLSSEKCPKLSNVAHPSHNPPSKNITLDQLHIKSQLQSKLSIINQAVIDRTSCSKALTPLQTEIYSLLAEYYDFYYTLRNFQNADELRLVYCLHAANHIWKTRNRIVHHNAKMANRIEVPEEFRDQGFVRPKILILAPFKDSALKIIQTLISIILPEEKGAVANKKRFNEEYGGTTLFLPKTNPKPDDYMATFGGNCDDNYKIGLSITKKSVKLYTGFYSSDIIVASPLGLRMIIGAEGERDREYDFLSSIELLIMDQSDVFLMQNWDHVLHIMKNIHLQPVTTHGTDFGRIRPWALDGLTKYYCQTIIFSSYMCPEHNALFSKYCRNFSGCVKVVNQISKGDICHVTVQLPQVFQQFDCNTLQSLDDDRFDFFVKKILPNFKDKLMSHTLIFVSSYFDFVRLRNHFKREEVSFVQICEYTKDKKIARARDLFFHNQNHFMIYTERAHFFRRFRLKGIGHIIFYQLPQNPHFYSELCDFIQEGFQTRKVRLRKNSSVNVIYCKYDAPRLSAIVGTERAAHMISSEKKVHAFVSGEF